MKRTVLARVVLSLVEIPRLRGAGKTLLAAATLLLVVSSAVAQTGGDYDLEWSIIGSAGDQFASGGGYQVGFTVGQEQEALISSGGSYQVAQGYWSGTGFSPTSVMLAGFRVQAEGNALVIRWETASEINLLGFNLYRSEGGEPGSYALVNGDLILAQVPGSSLGASYEWIDTNVAAGPLYYYLLEDMSIDGQTTQHGPVAATVLYRLHLPFVAQGF